jgi:CDP-diacylglycerol--glycerol-3-phosphate 3-phosphatidyltransferase
VNDAPHGGPGPGETSPPPPGTAAPPVGIVNVANVLTVVRILLVPVFVLCLVHGGTVWRLAALAAFGGASFTDFLDGQLARKRGLVTDFGKIADPIADKALTGAALITLSVLGELPGWVTGLILARELGITALRFAVIRRGVIAASQGGKLKTLLQIIAICLYVLPASLGLPSVIKEAFMAAALVVTLVTGADYVVRAVRLGRTPRAGYPPGGQPSAPPEARTEQPDREDRDHVTPPRADLGHVGTGHRLSSPWEGDTWQMVSRARPPGNWPRRSSGC